MATIYFTKGDDPTMIFFQSNVDKDDLKSHLEYLNQDPFNFVDGEQIRSFDSLEKDMQEYEFYGFSSKEDMMLALYPDLEEELLF